MGPFKSWSHFFRIACIALLLWSGIVVLLFKAIAEPRTAGLFASFGFLILGFGLLRLTPQSDTQTFSRWSLWIVISWKTVLRVFVFGLIFPIFILRILNWGQEFGNIYIGPIPLAALHRLSTFLYSVLVAVSALGAFVFRRESFFHR